jgi:hypothetical protein
MSNLSNHQINQTFAGLLQVPGGITSTLKTVQDGNGNPTGLQISSTGVNVTTSNTFVASNNGIAYTGTTPRLISDGFGDIVSVKDFGAVGDGVANDTTAFANAATSGGLVYITAPSTSYNFPSPINYKTCAWLPDPSVPWVDLTDNGQFNLIRGSRSQYVDGVNIWRFCDRVFIGDAASNLSGNDTANNPGTSWIGNTTNYPGYLGVNGKVVVSSDASINDLPYMIVAGARTSDTQQEAIGLGVTVVADSTPAYKAWGSIFELQLETNSQMFGIEIAAKNKSAYNNTMTPNAQTTGVFGLWLAAGGDNAFGGASVNPSTAGIAFVKNSNTWNTGIVFMRDALTSGSAISMSSDAVGGDHTIGWFNAAGNSTFYITSNNTTSTQWSLRNQSGGVYIYKQSSMICNFSGPTTVANGLTVYAGGVGEAVRLLASGTDTNIDISFVPQGTGVVKYGTHTASADAPISGYITIKDSAGNLRKLAVIS